MAHGTLYLQPKWFSEASPKNPKPASATLAFTGVVVDGETVAIKTEIYEFKASGDAGEGKIKVDVSEGLTADIAVAELAEAINKNSNLIVAEAVSDENQDIVIINYKSVGAEGNTITIGTNSANASFGEDVTTLLGGQLGTACSIRNVVVQALPYYYWCEKEGSDHTVSWKRFAPASY